MSKNVIIGALLLVVGILIGVNLPGLAAEQREGRRGPAPLPTLDQLPQEVATLRQLIPTNSTIMMDVQWHWTNLWWAGKKRNWPLAQYYFNEPFTARTDLRFRQTFFWDTDESFGTTSRGDLSHALSERNVLRWEGVATVSVERDGLFWYAGQTWYHLFEGMSAISLLAFVRGETDEPEPLQEYGFNLIWRRPLDGEWLYLSMGPSLTWPRYDASETRTASWGFGAWIEMEFGDYRY